MEGLILGEESTFKKSVSTKKAPPVEKGSEENGRRRQFRVKGSLKLKAVVGREAPEAGGHLRIFSAAHAVSGHMVPG